MEVDEKWVVGEHQLAVCRSDVNVSSLSFVVLLLHVTSLPVFLPFTTAYPLLRGVTSYFSCITAVPGFRKLHKALDARAIYPSLHSSDRFCLPLVQLKGPLTDGRLQDWDSLEQLWRHGFNE